MSHLPVNKSEINDKYFCKICNDIYRNVQQAECGCRYCLDCLEKQLPNEECFICEESICADVKITDRAFQRDINNMVVNCVECDWSGKYVDYKDHFKKHEVIKCPYCNSTFANDDLLKNHLDEKTGDCAEQPMHCLYSDIGCSKNDYNRKTLLEHSKNETANHLKFVYTDLNTRITKLENQYQSVISSKSEATSYNIFHEDMMKQNTHSSSKSRTNSSNKSKPEDSDIDLNLESLEYCQKFIKDDLTKYANLCEKLREKFDEIQTNKKNDHENCENIQNSLLKVNTTIIGLEERVLALEKVSFNGTLLWKLTNVKDKIMDAILRRQTYIDSPSFYTHQNGFKMCGRIYFNIDPIGKNHQISLYFAIMRGEFDALLRWPFRQKVTFTLMHQSTNEQHRNITDSFRPDTSLSQRPTGESNIVGGIPQFCPISQLNPMHEYVKEDCMFIKIKVDTKKLPDIV